MFIQSNFHKSIFNSSITTRTTAFCSNSINFKSKPDEFVKSGLIDEEAEISKVEDKDPSIPGVASGKVRPITETFKSNKGVENIKSLQNIMDKIGGDVPKEVIEDFYSKFVWDVNDYNGSDSGLYTVGNQRKAESKISGVLNRAQSSND